MRARVKKTYNIGIACTRELNVLSESEVLTMDIQLIANIVFGVSVGLVALFALIGLVKGIWKTGFALIIQAVLMIVAVFAAPAVGQAIGSFNLSSLGTITIGETVIQITSLRQTVCDAITAMGLISPVQGQTIYQAALAVTDIILALAAYILMCILSIFLSWALSALLYHTLVKWFIPKRVRLKHRLRPLGVVAGAAMGFLASTLAIAPFSSVITFLGRNQLALNNLVDRGYIDEDILTYLDQLEGSAYGGGWLGGLDDSMLQSATTVNFNGTKVSAADLMDLVTGVSGPFTGALTSADLGQWFDYTVLLSPTQTVNAIFDTLISSNLIMGLMPALCEVAVTFASDNTPVDLSGLSFEDIDFSSELTSLQEAYNQLYATGLFDQLVEDPASISFTQEDRDNVVAALGELGGMDIVAQNMDALLVLSSQYVQQSTGYALLSLDASKYEGIDWSRELSILSSAAFDLAAAAGVDLSVEAFKDTDQLVDQIMASLGQPNHLNYLRRALVGDSQGHEGLLDMSLFARGVIDYSQVTALLFASVPTLGEFLDREQLTSLLEDMNIQDLKRDVGIIVDILPQVDILVEKSHEQTGNWTDIVIDLGDEETIGALKSIVNQAGESRILSEFLPIALSKALPSILENQFGQPSFMGLDASSFDLSGGPAFFEDLSSFLDVAGDLMSLIDAASMEGTTAAKIAAIDPGSFSRVLKALINSSVFNPDRAIDGEVVSNTNLVTFLTSAMESFGLDQLGFTVPEDAESIDWNQEADHLAQVLETFQDNIDILGPDNNIILENVTSQGLEDLVLSVSRSQLLAPSLERFLDTQISARADMLGLRLRFAEIEDWTAAAAALGDIWDLAHPFIFQLDIDYTQLDYTYLNALLTALYQSGFVPQTEQVADGSYIDPFGSFIYSVALETGIFEQLHTAPDITIFWQIDRETGSLEDWTWVASTEVAPVSVPGLADPVSVAVTTDGEIFDLCWAFSEVTSLDFDTLGTPDGPDGDLIYNVLAALEDSHIGHGLLPSAIEYVLQSVGTISVDEAATIDFTDVDVDLLATMDIDQRLEQYDRICQLYDIWRIENLSAMLTIESLTSWDQPTLIPAPVVGPEGEITFLTVKEVVTTILDYALTSPLFTSVRSGHDYSFASSLLASIYEVSRMGQISMGLGSETLADAHQRVAVFRRLEEMIDALTPEQLNQEEDLILNILELVQTRDGFEINAFLDDPTGYINPDNVDLVFDDVIVPLMKAVDGSWVIHAATPEFMSLMLDGSGLFETLAILNSDVAGEGVLPTAIDVTALGYGRLESGEEIDRLFTMIRDLFILSGADTLKGMFVALIPADSGQMFHQENLAKVTQIAEAISESRIMRSLRAWLMRGVYVYGSIKGQSIYTLGLADGFLGQPGERELLGLDEVLDPYCILTVEDMVFNRHQIVPTNLQSIVDGNA